MNALVKYIHQIIRVTLTADKNCAALYQLLNSLVTFIYSDHFGMEYRLSFYFSIP